MSVLISVKAINQKVTQSCCAYNALTAVSRALYKHRIGARIHTQLEHVIWGMGTSPLIALVVFVGLFTQTRVCAIV